MYHSSNSAQTIYFPIAFNNMCLSVVKNLYCNTNRENQVLFREVGVYDITKTSFDVGASYPPTDVYYLSAGY